MKAHKRKTKDDIFRKLAEANLKKDYNALALHCDELLEYKDESITEEVKKAICEIKIACIEKNEEKIRVGFERLAATDDSQEQPSNARMYTSKLSDALKKKDKDTAYKISKEFSEKTAEAMKAIGKKPLADDFLYNLITANNRGESRKVQKMLKQIPKE